jgi:UDP-3-O-[3-hydroxymyristoyl] N-acetylglucosamine deacetylase/3-hydroxyacyl-[acyl-carrier-protein] dehydratase
MAPSLSFFLTASFAFPAHRSVPRGDSRSFLSTEITPEILKKEIAPARTFVFYEDVKPLMDKGLIKGGSLENAIVARGDSVLSKEPLSLCR